MPDTFKLLVLAIVWCFVLSLCLTLVARAIQPARRFWTSLFLAWGYGVAAYAVRIFTQAAPGTAAGLLPDDYTLWDYLRYSLGAHGLQVVYILDIVIMAVLVVGSTWVLRIRTQPSPPEHVYEEPLS